ncbi:MAG: hypothetical protein WB542_17625 [Polaromonas sp.]
MAVFDAEAKFLITSCVVTAAGNTQLSYELVDGSVQHSLVPDPLETYRIRYDELNSPMKVTSATVTLYPNGMLKSINAEVDDRTAQVMASMAGVALNVFKIATLGAVPTAAPPGAKPCDDAVIGKRIKDRLHILAILPDAKVADKALADSQETADGIAVQLEETKAKLSEAQKTKDAEAIAKLQARVNSLHAQWKVANAKLTGKSMQVAALQAKLAVLTDELTASAKTFGWAPRLGGAICKDFSVNQKQFLERLATSHQEKLSTPPSPADLFDAQVCVDVPAEARKGQAAADKAVNEADNSHEGVVYRLPAMGYVRVQSKSGDRQFNSTGTVSLPQFGAKGLVWLRNKPFDKNSVRASFNEDGSMSELGFKAESQAERAAAAATDTSKALVDLMQLRSDAIKAKTQAADDAQKKVQQQQIDALDAQIALLNKRKNLESARVPTMDVLDKEKDLLQKQIDVETLRQQYEALRKKAGS